MTGFSVLIPARYRASRLPGKPLRELGGVPLVCRVVERARASGASRVAVATDDERIAATVQDWGGEAVMTSPECASGTDRLAQAAAELDLEDREPVVNVQGDEPFMPPGLIREVAESLDADPERDMATAAHPLREWKRVLDPNCVKVVTDQQGDALYFSRAPVPWPRDVLGGIWPEPGGPAREEPPQDFRLHIGIYAYRAGFLRRFAGWAPTPLEEREALEQLRALENGVRLRVIECTHPPGLGVDTPEDLVEAEKRLSESDPNP